MRTDLMTAVRVDNFYKGGRENPMLYVPMVRCKQFGHRPGETRTACHREAGSGVWQSVPARDPTHRFFLRRIRLDQNG